MLKPNILKLIIHKWNKNLKVGFALLNLSFHWGNVRTNSAGKDKVNGKTLNSNLFEFAKNTHTHTHTHTV